MKKAICLFLTLIMLISAVACGTEQNSTTTEKTSASDATEQPVSALDVIELGYKVVYDLSDPDAMAVMSSMLSSIEEKLGKKPKSFNSGNSEIEYEI